MQIFAKLTQVLEIESFTGASGEFQVQRIIVEQENQAYSKDLCIDVNPTRIDMRNFPIGSRLMLDINLQSRSYNGKWFTRVKAWNITLVENNTANYNHNPIPDSYKVAENSFNSPAPDPSLANSTPSVSAPAETADDDLPF